MRLRMFAFIATLALPATTWGQTREPLPSWSIRPLTGSPSDGWPRDPLPRWSIPPLSGRPADGPLPKIGLPLPPIGLRPPVDWNDRGRHHWRGTFAPWPVMFVVVMFVPQVAAPILSPAARQPTPPEPLSPRGSLILQVQPGVAQVFVDGYYVGTADDLSAERGGAFLDTGPRRIELSAPGYEPVTFDVKIAPSQAIAYRRELKLIHTPPPAPPMPRTPTTFYLIPGCYMGNVPPKDAGLPQTCDVTRTLTFQN